MERHISKMLDEYLARGLSPWHMPGHKRKPLFGGFWDEAFCRDVTEVPGTDDLHHPEGAILSSQQAAAKVYGAAYSHYLVGGSTAGILAGVLVLAAMWKEKAEDQDSPVFLIGGNSHRSVHHALRLASAEGVILMPEGDSEYGPVLPDTVERRIAELDSEGKLGRIAGCVITSPTYGGIISPLREIRERLAERGIPLLVDEAHGAHFPFVRELAEKSGIAAGALFTVQSLHKTLPALTQTGIIHVGKDGDLSEKAEAVLARMLSVVQSSSPSYLLLASAEQAVAWADESREELEAYFDRIRLFRKSLEEGLVSLGLEKPEPFGDPSRFLLRGPGIPLAAWLEREKGIVAELAGREVLILISTARDSEEDQRKLGEALFEADRWLQETGSLPEDEPEREEKTEQEGRPEREEKTEQEGKPEREGKTEREGAGQESRPEEELQEIRPGEAVKEDVYAYPPGVLYLKKGEIMTEEMYRKLREEARAGRRIYGVKLR